VRLFPGEMIIVAGLLEREKGKGCAVEDDVDEVVLVVELDELEVVVEELAVVLDLDVVEELEAAIEELEELDEVVDFAEELDDELVLGAGAFTPIARYIPTAATTMITTATPARTAPPTA